MSTDKPATHDSANRFLIDAPWFRNFVGKWILAPYVRLVVRTNHKIYSPANHLTASAAIEPAIYLTWHANLLAQNASVGRTDHLVNMTSPHPDGLMAGALSEALGAKTISAAGGSDQQGAAGGIAGFRAMLRALKDGRSLFLTGEIPPIPGRQVAQGIIAVARLTGRPIIPIGAASTRQHIVERLWDKMQINYPFGTMFIESDPPIWVSREMSEDEAAAKVKASLDATYARAMAKAAAARQSPRS